MKIPWALVWTLVALMGAGVLSDWVVRQWPQTVAGRISKTVYHFCAYSLRKLTGGLVRLGQWLRPKKKGGSNNGQSK